MKISFIRGPFLNPWELQTYQQIAQKHEFTALGGDWQIYTGPIDIQGISIKRAAVWGESLPSLSLKTLYNRALSWSIGRSFGFHNLDAHVRGADILHAAELHSTQTYQCLEIKRRRGVRLVLTVWENLLHMGELHPLRGRRKRQVIQEADGFLAVTQTTHKMLQAEGVHPERIMTIPMAVDLQRFQPFPVDRSKWGFSKDDFVILFMGRLVEEKGILDLLKAIPLVLKAAPQKSLRFCFMGAGPLKGSLQDARAQFPNSICIQPFLPYDEIPSFHNLADLFVLPSKPQPKWEEQFGYVLVESMACGKPVLATRSGSIPDVIGEAGLLVSPSNPGALAQKLLEAIRNPAQLKQLGFAARRRAESVFSVDAVTPLLQTFYERAYRERG